MTAGQESHIKRIIRTFEKQALPKFAAGAKEHGNDLRDLSASAIAEHAREEALDGYIYLCTLIEKVAELEIKNAKLREELRCLEATVATLAGVTSAPFGG